MMMALVVLLIGGNACTEEDKGLFRTMVSHWGMEVMQFPIQRGQSLFRFVMRTMVKTVVGLFEAGGFYIDGGDNFVPYHYGYYVDDIDFCSVGAVNGLGNVREAPSKGWASTVAVQEGHGYFVRYKTNNGYYVYARCMWRNIFCRQPTRYWGPMSNISRRMNLKI